MKKLIYLFVGLLTLIFVASCSNESLGPVEPVAEFAEVSFNINNFIPDTASKDDSKDETLPDCSDEEPDHVVLYLGEDENAVKYTLKLVTLNNGLETEVIKLPVGKHTISSFVVNDAAGKTIYASPMNDSYYANLWGLIGVTETFTVTAFTKMKVNIDVLCYQPYDYEKFGFAWLEYAKYQVKTVCFFGDIICTEFYNEWHESHLNDDQEEINPYFGQPYDGYDFPAIFEVVIKGKVLVEGEEVWARVNDPNFASNVEWKGTGDPLCIEYPDLVGTDEDFIAEIWLALPDGSLELIETVTFTDANWSGADGDANFGGSDGVYDFVIEKCTDDEEEKEVSCETAYGFGDTCFLDLGFSRWGWTIGTLEAQTDTFTFDIYAGAAQCDTSKGTLVGNLTVTYDGSTAVVTYTMNSGYTMSETQLYVGNDNLPSDNGSPTVAPGQYGNIHDDLDEVSTDSYTISGLSGPIYVVAHATVCGEYPEDE